MGQMTSYYKTRHYWTDFFDVCDPRFMTSVHGAYRYDEVALFLTNVVAGGGMEI
jgi:hypothetical protein